MGIFEEAPLSKLGLPGLFLGVFSLISNVMILVCFRRTKWTGCGVRFSILAGMVFHFG